MSTMGERIRVSREEKGLLQAQLAELVGAKSAGVISNWENNINKPDAEKIVRLCEALGASVSYILDYHGDTTFSISLEEQSFIKRIRTLDAHGKEVVENLLDAECRRMEELKKTATESKKPQTRFIDFYHLPVSAGTGIEITDETSDMIEIPINENTLHADYVLRVSGKSMEPLYEDGDLILIQSMPTVDVGDLGIFIINNEAFFKKRGKHALISLNSKFPNIPLNEFDRIDCKGKVLGKIK